MVRGQSVGYRQEPDVAEASDVETFRALRLFIDSWRWEGVPFYPRSGKYLAQTFTEVLVELEPPPQPLFDKTRDGLRVARCSSIEAQPTSSNRVPDHD